MKKFGTSPDSKVSIALPQRAASDTTRDPPSAYASQQKTERQFEPTHQLTKQFRHEKLLLATQKQYDTVYATEF